MKDSVNFVKEGIFQIIDERGECHADHNLSKNKLREMFWWMIYSRRASEKALKMQRQGKIGTFLPLDGQEASQVGSAMAINKEDWIFPTYREMGAQIVRSVPLVNILLYYAGDIRGNLIPKNVNNLPFYIPVGTQIPHATGTAWAMKIQKKRSVVLCYLGDGATSKGDFHEGLNFAGVMKSPVIFFCQNNGWAISVPREKQTASRTIAQKAFAYGMEGLIVDGNDVIAVYLAVQHARKRAMEGVPTLIEALTYRMKMHSTADDPKRYEDNKNLKIWEKKDPIKRMRLYLKKEKIWTRGWEKTLEKKADRLIEDAVKKMGKVSQLTPEDMFNSIYSKMTPKLTEELEYLKENLANREVEEETQEIKGGFP
ncbi:MAG: pyruvate dehydrogenase (acetyl-transferring) E1 component subunit alpha [Candidatus Nanoarchaeia archaeon]|nr:pyruvate dehydrogenase (acetyl-transferring) E1 component subunit alpha [Candidatus Nanoarchaeia archaeon]